MLPSLFPGQTIAHSYETLYELKDSLKRNGNILIISSSFSCQKEDTESLLNYINAGGTAFISAQHFYGTFQDTLGFSTRDNLWKQNNFLNQADSAYIRFVNPRQDTTEHFSYRRDNLYNYFSYFDTTKTTVIARNDFEQPVSLLVRWGKGTIHLNCTPLAFTNIYLLAGKNHSFASASLSHLPVDDLLWTEYYHVGRMEASTPLRFILTNEPLSWAYYLTVLSLLIFMIDPDKIGIMGFSAGGHLASTEATHFKNALIENKNNTSLRPDFQILVYPVISMRDSLTHRDSRSKLLGKDPSAYAINDFSNELQVAEDTPPAYITYATDDKLVDVDNGIAYYQALRHHNVDVEMHIYAKGGHGFIFREKSWTEPLFKWMRKNELLK